MGEMIGSALTVIRQSLGGLALLAVVVFVLVYYGQRSGVGILKEALARNDKDRSDLEKRMTDLEADVADLHEQLNSQKTWRRIAVRHIRDLREFIAGKLPGQEMPPIPAGLDLDD